MRFTCGTILVVLLLGITVSHAQPPRASRFISVNGIRLHYVEWGRPEKPRLRRVPFRDARVLAALRAAGV